MSGMTKELREELRKKEAKRIRDRNYRFRKMSPDRKRVAIAKDVLSLLAANKLKAKEGVYLRIKKDTENKFWRFGLPRHTKAGVQVQDVLKDEKCTVCGIGACFVAAVLRADECSVGDMGGLSDDAFMREYLSNWFSLKQIMLIECAFERSDAFYVDEYTSTVKDAVEFGKSYDDDGDRLTAIFENIVKNRGRFRPPKRTAGDSSDDGYDDDSWDGRWDDYDDEDDDWDL